MHVHLSKDEHFTQSMDLQSIAMYSAMKPFKEQHFFNNSIVWLDMASIGSFLIYRTHPIIR